MAERSSTTPPQIVQESYKYYKENEVELHDTHPGEYLAFLGAFLIDSDVEEDKLLQRAREGLGDQMQNALIIRPTGPRKLRAPKRKWTPTDPKR